MMMSETCVTDWLPRQKANGSLHDSHPSNGGIFSLDKEHCGRLVHHSADLPTKSRSAFSPRELLAVMDDHIAVERGKFHQECPAAGLLGGDQG